ncbi:hypothetical protein L873DRAFT_421723, partial [Choiromyces venosus 120613-1]
MEGWKDRGENIVAVLYGYVCIGCLRIAYRPVRGFPKFIFWRLGEVWKRLLCLFGVGG